MSMERPSKREIGNAFTTHAKAINGLIAWGKKAKTDLETVTIDVAAIKGTPGLRGLFGRLRFLILGR